MLEDYGNLAPGNKAKVPLPTKTKQCVAKSDSLEADREGLLFEADEMKLKLLWRPQHSGDARIIRSPLRKAEHTMWNKFKGELMSDDISRAGGPELPKLFRVHMIPS